MLSDNFFELADAFFGGYGAEVDLPLQRRELQRTTVKVECCFRLADVFECNRQVKRIVGIIRLQLMGLKKRLLCVRPALLVDIGDAQSEMQVGGSRLPRNQLFDACFCRLRISTAEHADQRRLGQRVARIEFENF